MKAKIIADNDVDQCVIDCLYKKKFNVIDAKKIYGSEINRNDPLLFQKANEENSWILAGDNGFLNHKKYPFQKIKGIIKINKNVYPNSCPLQQILWIFSHRKNNDALLHKKYVITEKDVMMYSEDNDGPEILKDNDCYLCWGKN